MVGPHQVETPAGVVTTFYTTDDYVDCECDDDDIQPVSESPAGLAGDALDNHVVCRRCGTVYADAPSSRADEALARGLEIDAEVLERHGPAPAPRQKEGRFGRSQGRADAQGRGDQTDPAGL